MQPRCRVARERVPSPQRTPSTGLRKISIALGGVNRRAPEFRMLWRRPPHRPARDAAAALADCFGMFARPGACRPETGRLVYLRTGSSEVGGDAALLPVAISNRVRTLPSAPLRRRRRRPFARVLPSAPHRCLLQRPLGLGCQRPCTYLGLAAGTAAFARHARSSAGVRGGMRPQPPYSMAGAQPRTQGGRTTHAHVPEASTIMPSNFMRTGVLLVLLTGIFVTMGALVGGKEGMIIAFVIAVA